MIEYFDAEGEGDAHAQASLLVDDLDGVSGQICDYFAALDLHEGEA